MSTSFNMIFLTLLKAYGRCAFNFTFLSSNRSYNTITLGGALILLHFTGTGLQKALQNPIGVWIWNALIGVMISFVCHELAYSQVMANRFSEHLIPPPIIRSLQRTHLFVITGLMTFLLLGLKIFYLKNRLSLIAAPLAYAGCLGILTLTRYKETKSSNQKANSSWIWNIECHSGRWRQWRSLLGRYVAYYGRAGKKEIVGFTLFYIVATGILVAFSRFLNLPGAGDLFIGQCLLFAGMGVFGSQKEDLPMPYICPGQKQYLYLGQCLLWIIYLIVLTPIFLLVSQAIGKQDPLLPGKMAVALLVAMAFIIYCNAIKWRFLGQSVKIFSIIIGSMFLPIITPWVLYSSLKGILREP